jgi:hypothetical protein
VVLAECGAQGALVRGEQIGGALAGAHEQARRALDRLPAPKRTRRRR